MLESEHDEEKWPDLTRFRKACLEGNFSVMEKIAAREHSWYANENPDRLPMAKLAVIARAQHFASRNEKEELRRLVEGDQWVINHPWTAQRWLPMSQAASSHGDREMIELMLALGADPTRTVGKIGEEGTIPDLARWGGHNDLAEWLEGIIKNASDQSENPQ